MQRSAKLCDGELDAELDDALAQSQTHAIQLRLPKGYPEPSQDELTSPQPLCAGQDGFSLLAATEGGDRGWDRLLLASG
jgi:hypothetical protein